MTRSMTGPNGRPPRARVPRSGPGGKAARQRAARQQEVVARRSAEVRAKVEAAARQREAAARRTAEARVAELEALLEGKRG